MHITICNPTDNENAASFVDASTTLMQSDCLHLCQELQIILHVRPVRKNGWKKSSYIKEGRSPIKRRAHLWIPQGPSCAESTCSPCARVGILQLPLTVQTCIWVGQIDLRCEYLCESLLLYVSPAMSWWLQGRRWTGGFQHHIIKQGFAHYKHGCLFRKLLWPILKTKLLLP